MREASPLKFAHHLLLVFACFVSLVAQAASTSPTAEETRALLTSNRFDELDARYGAIQQAYVRGAISDVDLRTAFRTFYDTDPALESQYLAWVTHSPTSYVAHLARGIYHHFVARKRAGNDRREQNAIAAKELEKSLGLEQRPLLTYLHSLEIESSRTGIPGARKLLAAAIAIDPKAFIVREKFMGQLRTQVGGSQEAMKGFLEECRIAGLSVQQLDRLESLVLEDEAWVHRYGENDPNAAIDAYQKAAKADPSAACVPCGPLAKAGDLAVDQKDFARADELFSEILTHDANQIHALNQRGFARPAAWPGKARRGGSLEVSAARQRLCPEDAREDELDRNVDTSGSRAGDLVDVEGS